MPDYDVIVVGAGLGGLSAAAVLARAGRSVLVVERHDGPGGCARAFQRGPYRFDPAVHILEEAGDGRLVDLLLRHLGVRDECELVPVPELYRAVFPGMQVMPPVGRDEGLADLIRHFGHQERELTAWYDLLERFFGEASHLTMRVGLRDLDDAAATFPTFFGYRNATVGQVLDQCFTDPRVKAVCSAIWPYMGLPPSRLSFYTFAQLSSVLLTGGAFYCRGSFQRLADAFVTALRRDGGDIVYSCPVSRIVIDHGRVHGVVAVDGMVASAPVVVANADATSVVEDLVGVDHLPAGYVRRLRRMEPSLSAFILYAATDLDLSVFEPAHETFLYRHWDHDATYRDIIAVRPGGMWVNVPTLLDSSLAPAGEHLVIMTALAPYRDGTGDGSVDWPELREPYTAAMLRELEAVFPGIGERLTHLESATPRTVEAFTGARDGAIYGWAVTPGQTGNKRLAHRTGIDGLYLAGHWTHEGPSSFRAMLSGAMAARAVLTDAGEPELVPTLRPTGFPERFGEEARR